MGGIERYLRVYYYYLFFYFLNNITKKANLTASQNKPSSNKEYSLKIGSFTPLAITVEQIKHIMFFHNMKLKDANITIL